jgi:GrpB-like predicted nucleotidyltransferase (UPF0157 family)
MKDNFEIVICSYNESWTLEYLREFDDINKLLNSNEVIDIQHFGSTAIPGLAAKPIIDILVGFSEFSIAEKNISALNTLGYEYVVEVSVPGARLFFKKEPRTHHVHFVEFGSEHWHNPLKFRDYLRVHDEKRIEYEALKRLNSEKYKHDRVAYGNAKTLFVINILSK